MKTKLIPFSLLLLHLVLGENECIRHKLTNLFPLEIPEFRVPMARVSNTKLVELGLGELQIKREQADIFSASAKIHHLFITAHAHAQISTNVNIRITDADIIIKFKENPEGSRELIEISGHINHVDVKVPVIGIGGTIENQIRDAIRGKWLKGHKHDILRSEIGKRILEFFEKPCDFVSSSCAPNKICSGEIVIRQHPYWSPNHHFYFIDQDDGNLVVYDRSNRAIWNARTAGHIGPNRYSIMQKDGNFVLYSAGAARWSSGTSHNEGAELVMQDDGNLVIYKQGVALWSSKTGKLSASVRHLNDL